MIPTLQVPVVPVTPVDPNIIGLPPNLTITGIILIFLWIVLNKLPAILASLGELIQTIVLNRRNQNSSFVELMTQIQKDRDYWNQERTRMQLEIDELSAKMDNLQKELEDRDELIRALKTKEA